MLFSCFLFVILVIIGLGGSMAILGIATGKCNDEIVKILDGEVWKIDKYTMAFADSYELRAFNAASFAKFQSLYPYAKNGSVRLFLNGTDKEWFVFYKKHRHAFEKIILDHEFIEYYAEMGSKYFSRKDVDIIDHYPHRISVYMKQFCQALIDKDLKQTGQPNGGALYYGFMRDILYKYLNYSRQNKNAKTIDQLSAEYFSEQISIQIACLNTPPSNDTPVMDRGKELDPDYEMFYSMDTLETRYDKLKGFLGNPNFDRYYGDIFKDSYLFILGNKAEDYWQQEVYQKWYEYGTNGFDGTVICPAIFKNSGYVDRFDAASIVFFCVFDTNPEVERMISLALLNQSEVIIQLYDSTLYPKYIKKYPKATIVLQGVQDEDSLLDATDDFMISCYNRVKEKRYQK